ncbi:MAG TPA: tRNA (guanosine(37)-N1)-methyltransferase TrmD [bacterium]|nr:tRNA (guanosine(37)-N1)-methyltransferase TrmD [bacterium]
MRFEVITLFPEVFPGVLGVGVVGRALEKGLITLAMHNPRDFTRDRHRTVDDAPFGGGPGMVMKPEPLFECVENLGDPRPLRILLSPQGEPFTQDAARRLAAGASRIALICGRYEGVDERIRLGLADLDLSVGDYVLSGGEIAAMAVIETMARLIPGVVGDRESVDTDSLEGSLLKYPQYTRPREYRGMTVPDILLSGHHEEIESWRREQSLKRTKTRRPDLFSCNKSEENGN